MVTVLRFNLPNGVDGEMLLTHFPGITLVTQCTGKLSSRFDILHVIQKRIAADKHVEVLHNGLQPSNPLI